MINTVVLCGKPTNETVDETTGPHGSGETTCSDNVYLPIGIHSFMLTTYFKSSN